MMKEEEYIRNRAGSRNPFRVPEGYFDSFASQMTAKLPDRVPPVAVPPRRPRLRLLRPLLYAAACVCVAVFSLTAYLMSGQSAASDEDTMAASQQYQYAPVSTYEDDVLDCAMMDNTDIYAYLSSEH